MTHIHWILKLFILECTSRGQLANPSAQNMSKQIKGCLSTPHALQPMFSKAFSNPLSTLPRRRQLLLLLFTGGNWRNSLSDQSHKWNTNSPHGFLNHFNMWLIWVRVNTRWSSAWSRYSGTGDALQLYIHLVTIRPKHSPQHKAKHFWWPGKTISERKPRHKTFIWSEILS